MISLQTRLGTLLGVLLEVSMLPAGFGQTGLPAPSAPELREGRALLQTKHYREAKTIFASYLQAHGRDVQARVGLGDAELGLRQYGLAEGAYREAVAQQPELWQAHKNLVVVEAALGRWEDFDGERKILRLARERGAPGISPLESDVIDNLEVESEHWVVRAYFEPLGRSRALYNFERFSAAGRVEAYISLEDAAAAAETALQGGDVRIGGTVPGGERGRAPLALNWYTGAAHGTVRRYASGEPSYQQLRRDTLAWLHTRPVALRTGSR